MINASAFVTTTIRIFGPRIYAEIVLERLRQTLMECENKEEMSVEML